MFKDARRRIGGMDNPTFQPTIGKALSIIVVTFSPGINFIVQLFPLSIEQISFFTSNVIIDFTVIVMVVYVHGWTVDEFRA